MIAWRPHRVVVPAVLSALLLADPLMAEVSVDGTLWLFNGIEDRHAAYTPGYRGPEDQGTGLRIGRALIGIESRVESGTLQGSGIRIVPIAQSTMAQSSNTCRSDVDSAYPETCRGRNDYYFGLYHGYGDIVFSRQLTLRIGQQATPTTGSPVHDLNEANGYRFFDLVPSGRMGPSAAFDNLGFSGATDRGISLIYQTDSGGIHLMLGNEASGASTNGQNIAIITERTTAAKLDSAARGNGSSYGTDLQGLLNWKPLSGLSKWKLNFSVPFLLKNIYGIRSNEYNYTAVNVSCAAGCNVNPRLQWIRGSRAARQDYYYGFQTDIQVTLDEWKISVGGGPFFFMDRRGTAFMLTERILNPNDFFYISDQSLSNPIFVQELFGNNYRYDSNSLGRALYFYGSVEYRKASIFAQYTYGTGTGIEASSGRMTGVVSAPSTVPWLLQKSQLELQNYGTTQGVSYDALWLLRSKIDTGRARFLKVVSGLSYRLTDSMRIGVVHSIVHAIGTDGSAVKSNAFQKVNGFAASSGTEGLNLSDQMDRLYLTSMGFPVGVTTNDLIGKQRIEVQSALAMEVKF